MRWIIAAPARRGDGSFAVAAGAIALWAAALSTAVLIGAPAFAQGPPPPAGRSAAGAGPGQAQGNDQVQLIFSPWTKFCLKGQEANAKQVCFTGKDARIEFGMPVSPPS